jgi:hypothetical protein
MYQQQRVPGLVFCNPLVLLLEKLMEDILFVHWLLG